MGLENFLNFCKMMLFFGFDYDQMIDWMFGVGTIEQAIHKDYIKVKKSININLECWKIEKFIKNR